MGNGQPEITTAGRQYRRRKSPWAKWAFAARWSIARITDAAIREPLPPIVGQITSDCLKTSKSCSSIRRAPSTARRRNKHFSRWLLLVLNREETNMKMTTVALAAFFALGSGLALAQGAGGAGAGAGGGASPAASQGQGASSTSKSMKKSH